MRDQLLALAVVAGAIAVGWVVTRVARPHGGDKKQRRESRDGGSGGADYVGDSGANATDHGWFGGHGHSGDHGGGGSDDGGGADGGGDGGGGGGGSD